MKRLLLMHWNAREARERCPHLRQAGYTVEVLVPRDAGSLGKLQKRPPDAFLIDLTRRPIEGGSFGALLRQRKATRQVPLVFVGGEPDKVARVQKMLPDATFSDWRSIRGTIRRALNSVPAKPVTPGVLEGYSGTPLAKKLGIKAKSTLALLGAPAGFERQLQPLPEDVRIQKDARRRARTIVLFAKSRAVLVKRFPAAARALEEKGGLWIAWPKRASGVQTDLAERDVRAYGLDAGFVDYKICALDATWSGLLFARRKQTRG